MNIKNLLNPINIKNNIVGFIKAIPGFIRALFLMFGFFVLLFIYLGGVFYRVLEKIPILGKIFVILGHKFGLVIENFVNKIIARIEKARGAQLKSLYLIQLAHKNLLIKKTRSLITIFGMSVGVGIIVLLLSLGYGIEKLIVNRVARLDELKMIDVSAGENTTIRLNKSILEKLKKINKVEKAIPLISVVGRISYNRATTDVLVYSAPKSYLDAIQVKLKKGKMYSDDRTTEIKASEQVDTLLGQVAGATTKLEDGIYNTKTKAKTIKFNVLPQQSITIWKYCTINSDILGYFTRLEGGYYKGDEYWGGEYAPFAQNGRVGFDKSKNISLGKWIKAKFPVSKTNENGIIMKVFDEQGNERWEDGCIQEKNLQLVNEIEYASVLGEATASAETTATDSAASSLGTDVTVISASDSSGIETVSIVGATESASTKKTTQLLKFKHTTIAEAIVSSGFINLLNIKENKAVGTKFKSSFIIVKSLIPDLDGRVLTEEVEYKIIGVVDDDESTYFYVPFSDVYQLGIKNFSQLKVIVKDTNAVAKVRKEIETMGLKTSSTADTVKQIESLFANLRILLGILGLVALGVASLGMFNTLTVSLLERTREIGGMKAMGMVSQEVQDLFLAEAMIMGLAGGLGGLLMGYLGGELLSLFVSIIAIASGQGYLHLNYLPFSFIAFILLSSFFVGVVTGLYPAQRAKKISALNALRYE